MVKPDTCWVDIGFLKPQTMKPIQIPAGTVLPKPPVTVKIELENWHQRESWRTADVQQEKDP